MAETKKISSTILGAAGEHYVMAELLKRGVIAAKAPEGAPNMDIVTTDLEGNKLLAIQVKTRRDFTGGDKGWHMKAKHDMLFADRMFYVFVDVGQTPDDQPAFYVMPSKAVADACRISHKIWEETLGVNGKPHNHSDMRRLLPEYKRNDRMLLSPDQERFINEHSVGWLEQYRNAWHLLGLE